MIALVQADARIDAMRPCRTASNSRCWTPTRRAAAEFCVLGPPDLDRFADILPDLTALKVVQTLNSGVDRVPSCPATSHSATPAASTTAPSRNGSSA